MTVCAYCGNRIPHMPFKCKFCSYSFCADHYIPENHECFGLKNWKERRSKAFREGEAPIVYKIDEDFIFGTCSFHFCQKTTYVYKCEHCSKYFCEEHLQANLPGWQHFNGKFNGDAQFREQWYKEGGHKQYKEFGHPCPEYFDYVQKERKISEIRYLKTLDKLKGKTRYKIKSKRVEESKDIPAIKSELPIQSSKGIFHREKPPYDSYAPKKRKINIIKKVRFWFNHKKHPYSKLRINKFVKDIFFLIAFIFIAAMVYENINSAIFMGFGILVLIGIALLILYFGYEIFVNLKYGIRGLTNEYKLILAIFVLFFVLINFPTFVEKVNNFNISSFETVDNFTATTQLPKPTIKINILNETMLKIGPKEQTLEYTKRGSTGRITITVYSSLNDYLAKLSRWFYCDPTCPSNREIQLKYLDNKEQKEYLNVLVSKIKSQTENKDEQARIAISLVQKIPYDWVSFKNNKLTDRYPYEVIYENKGVCGEKSRLLAFILKELGFGVALLDFNKEKHMSVGIKCPTQYSYKNTGYCFVETAAPTIITDAQSDYVGEGKLSFIPDVIAVSDGISFNSVLEEYNDAQEWYKLDEISRNSGNYLDEYYYNKWVTLVNKYGIEVRK